MKTLTKEEVSKALAEAIVKASDNIKNPVPSRNYWKESDIVPFYGYGVKATKKGNTVSLSIIFTLYSKNEKVGYTMVTSIEYNALTWFKKHLYGGITPIADFFATFIGEIEVEEDNNELV